MEWLEGVVLGGVTGFISGISLMVGYQFVDEMLSETPGDFSQCLRRMYTLVDDPRSPLENNLEMLSEMCKKGEGTPNKIQATYGRLKSKWMPYPTELYDYAIQMYRTSNQMDYLDAFEQIKKICNEQHAKISLERKTQSTVASIDHLVQEIRKIQKVQLKPKLPVPNFTLLANDPFFEGSYLGIGSTQAP